VSADPPVPGPVLKSVTMHFHQTTDDKDWNTQVRDYLVCHGHSVAKLECCSADRRDGPAGDHWKDPGDVDRPMTVLEKPTKKDLDRCELQVGSQAKGNDMWRFVPTVHAEFSDGSVREWTLPATELDSELSQPTSKTYQLSEHPGHP
jgi:hypothetical protein